MPHPLASSVPRSLRALLTALVLFAAPLAPAATATASPSPNAGPAVAASSTLKPQARETAVFGGGCFWCIEAALEQLRGVDAVVNGYAGGHTDAPSYQAVCRGDTGHAEVVRVTYDPAVIGYRDLVRAFFVIHDPTTPNRQGADVGDQYRSIVLTETAAQARTVREVIAEFTRSGAFSRPIVTEVRSLVRFFPAEAYHQDYFAQHPNQPYCQLVVAPKVEKLRHRFVDRLKR